MNVFCQVVGSRRAGEYERSTTLLAKTVAFTVLAIEEQRRDEGRPLCGNFSFRTRSCLQGLVRMAVMAFPPLMAHFGMVGEFFWSKSTSTLHTQEKMSPAEMARDMMSSGDRIMDVDAFSVLIQLCFRCSFVATGHAGVSLARESHIFTKKS